jgi:opacity protein-like surface antigen
MKKAVLVLAVILVLVLPSAAFAQKNWVGLVHKGDFAAYAGVGVGYGFSVVPGVEWAFADVKFGNTVPVAFGLTGKGILNFYPGFWSSYGLGALATAHLGLKGLDLPDFLQRLDFYISAGLGVSYFSWNSGYTALFNDWHFGFATADGVAYYFNDKWAIYAEGTYMGYVAGAVIGGRYTF